MILQVVFTPSFPFVYEKATKFTNSGPITPTIEDGTNESREERVFGFRKRWGGKKWGSNFGQKNRENNTHPLELWWNDTPP